MPSSSRLRAYTVHLVLAAGLVACSDDKTARTTDAASDPALPGDGATAEDSDVPEDDASAGDAAAAEDAGDEADASSDDDATTPDDDGAVDAGTDLFPADHLLEVKITVAPADFAALRKEGRTLNEVFSGCTNPSFGYAERRADVEIAGTVLPEVALRKKGFLGSLSVNKPSLRVELDAFDTKQDLDGVTDLTLNNSVSDATFTHQCMSYTLFNAAGIPAPRCGFAHVTVNGEDLGVYVNVEPVKKPFLKAHFDDAKGDLYEGAVADFRADMLNGFDKKTNEAEPQSPLLAQLANTLTLADDAMLAALPDAIDVEQFLTFWAMESMVGHWDGYTGDMNNFFVYVDPTKNKLTFLPWGTDGAFSATHSLAGAATPASVLAWARLPARLYAIPSVRARYDARLRELLAAHWKEDVLLAEVDRIAKLVGSAADPTALAKMRSFVSARKAAILAELDAATPPVWPIPERAATACHPELNVAISGAFETTWGDINATSAVLNNRLAATVAGTPVAPALLFSAAGNSNVTGPNLKSLRLTGIGLDTSLTVVQFVTGNPTLSPGVVPLHGFETFGVLLTGPSATALKVMGLIGDGTLVFDKVGVNGGDAVTGRFDAKLVNVAVAPPGAQN